MQANLECRFSLKRVRDMIITYSQIHCTGKNSIIWPVWLNELSVWLRIKWLWFRIALRLIPLFL